jgi:hypothetical protein
VLERAGTDLWSCLDALVDRTSLSALRLNALHLFAGRRLRALGRPVPSDLAAEERAAALLTLVAPVVLERVRSVCHGPLMLIKGPEVAAYYPASELRPFWDVDLLVPDAEEVQRALLAAGFQPIGDPSLYVGIHHLRPLVLPGLPVAVEVHSRPKWADGFAPPTTDELLEAGVPASVAVPGIDTLPAEHHALLLTAHAWAHEPLRRLRDLVDVAAVADAADALELRRLAAEWGVQRLWRTTATVAGAVLLGHELPRTIRRWACNLEVGRERTVLENHLARWLSGFAIFPPHKALLGLGAILASELRPAPEESWPAKVSRARTAIGNAFTHLSDHERSMDNGTFSSRVRERGVVGADSPPHERAEVA